MTQMAKIAGQIQTKQDRNLVKDDHLEQILANLAAVNSQLHHTNLGYGFKRPIRLITVVEQVAHFCQQLACNAEIKLNICIAIPNNIVIKQSVEQLSELVYYLLQLAFSRAPSDSTDNKLLISMGYRTPPRMLVMFKERYPCTVTDNLASHYYNQAKNILTTTFNGKISEPSAKPSGSTTKLSFTLPFSIN